MSDLNSRLTLDTSEVLMFLFYFYLFFVCGCWICYFLLKSREREVLMKSAKKNNVRLWSLFNTDLDFIVKYHLFLVFFKSFDAEFFIYACFFRLFIDNNLMIVFHKLQSILFHTHEEKNQRKNLTFDKQFFFDE